jgi:hypothetical protein
MAITALLNSMREKRQSRWTFFPPSFDHAWKSRVGGLGDLNFSFFATRKKKDKETEQNGKNLKF